MLLNTSIEDFFEPFRKSAGTRRHAVVIARYVVERLGATTVGEMIDKVTEADLYRVKGFGRRSMEILKEILTKSGLPQLEPGVPKYEEPEEKVYYQLRRTRGNREWLVIYDTKEEAEKHLMPRLAIYEVKTVVTRRMLHSME